MCIYRTSLQHNGVDTIARMHKFPELPRDDLVRSIYFYKMANGSCEKENININARSNLTKEVFNTHVAIFHGFVASCVTFSPPGKVPAGDEYHVSQVQMISDMRPSPLVKKSYLFYVIKLLQLALYHLKHISR